MRFLEDIPVNNKQNAAWLAENKTAEEKIIAKKPFFLILVMFQSYPRLTRVLFFFNINFLDSELEGEIKRNELIVRILQ